ncbi:hypothetical protein F6B41_04590 [Microbacterium lushaniae]|nr:hypothetical protein F6B41_25650 [Microbacterium lushaniae]KAA9157819.1 hypothetical protein F6B41_04590 [Microbacterium lushaniae]
MAVTLEDVRAVALAFPETVEAPSGYGFGPTWRTRNGMFAWQRTPTEADLTQLGEQGRSWPDGDAIAVRTDGLDEKAALLETFPEVFFTIPHFEGWSSVLVRLDAIDATHLGEVLTDSWLLKAPKRVAAAWLAAHPER